MKKKFIYWHLLKSGEGAQQETSLDQAHIDQLDALLQKHIELRELSLRSQSPSRVSQISTRVMSVLRQPYKLILKCFKRACKWLILCVVLFLVQCTDGKQIGLGLYEMSYQALVFGWDSQCIDPYRCEGQPKSGIWGILTR